MRKLMIIALAGIFAVAGCHSHKATSGKVLNPEYPWVYYDGEIEDVGIVSAIKSRTDNNLLRAQVQLRNTRRGLERILYKVTWLNAQGFTVSSLNDTWTVRILNSNEYIYIDVVAPSPEVVDCRIQLQKSER